MSDKDYIKDLFSDKLGNYEAKVNPELWNSIASQIGSAGAAGAAGTGLSLVAKWIIGVSIAGAVAVTGIIIATQSGTSSPSQGETIEQPAETPQSDTDNQTGSETNLITDSGNNAHEEVIPGANTQDPPFVPALNPVPFTEVDPVHNSTEHVLLPVILPQVNSKDPVVAEHFEKREPVHTKDPVVSEPLMPEVVAPEQPDTRESEREYSVGALPNIFTPNGDGANDLFSVHTENLTEFKIVVINSQNKVVFESEDPSFRWDGNDMTGNPVPDGNYVYYLTAREFGTEKPRRYSPLLIKR